MPSWCARPDLARTRGATGTVELIPNGVDVELFQTPQARPTELPPAPGGRLRRHPPRGADRRRPAAGSGRGPPGPPDRAGRSRPPRAGVPRPAGGGSQRSTCSGPSPTTGSPASSSTPTWSSSPIWSTRSPRASTRSRPTSAWPPAGPPWPPRSPDSATWGRRWWSSTGRQFVDESGRVLDAADPDDRPRIDRRQRSPTVGRAGRRRWLDVMQRVRAARAGSP